MDEILYCTKQGKLSRNSGEFKRTITNETDKISERNDLQSERTKRRHATNLPKLKQIRYKVVEEGGSSKKIHY